MSPETGTTLVSDLAALTANAGDGVVSSEMPNGTTRISPWAMTCSGTGATTGGSFASRTVMRNVRLTMLFDGAPSSMVTVMVVLPAASGTVAKLSVPVLCGWR